MKTTRRKFTFEEQLFIIQESRREGQTFTCRNYQLSPSLLARWKNRYLSKGVSGLQNSYKKIDPALRELELENERCLSPLNDWTKFIKQFCNKLILGYENNSKKIYT